MGLHTKLVPDINIERIKLRLLLFLTKYIKIYFTTKTTNNYQNIRNIVENISKGLILKKLL